MCYSVFTSSSWYSRYSTYMHTVRENKLRSLPRFMLFPGYFRISQPPAQLNAPRSSSAYILVLRAGTWTKISKAFYRINCWSALIQSKIYLYISDVYANTLDTKPNKQPVYPRIPIIPIVNNISPEPTIAISQINPT